MTQKNEGFTPGPWKRGGYNEYLGYDCMAGGLYAENERLRAALEEIAESGDAPYGIERIARAALNEGGAE